MGKRRAARSQPPAAPAGPGGGSVKQVRIRIGSSEGVPVLFANQVGVLYTGTEFFVSMVAAVLDSSGATPHGVEFPDELEGKVLARFAFTPDQWRRAVGSVVDQLDKLGLKPIPPDVFPAVGA